MCTGITLHLQIMLQYSPGLHYSRWSGSLERTRCLPFEQWGSGRKETIIDIYNSLASIVLMSCSNYCNNLSNKSLIFFLTFCNCNVIELYSWPEHTVTYQPLYLCIKWAILHCKQKNKESVPNRLTCTILLHMYAAYTYYLNGVLITMH